ncbi:hypothetical protein Ocepr_0216 [Oceanithermus profundus DSM 14977]|uniref:Uncharacterized protein n=1 Tax=Oceanithermus profundus (strain DSM 14977 / NBRC 100410 / VKM B-2274 / 506) TaxID=670487 RepID=E4U6J2_OCEP5|nr:hypothetical protein [Oceanithermus profundus]ADR35678.1 hypothetical protein Ocepr_0216 [Oceanithermus profundus DSM 14977]
MRSLGLFVVMLGFLVACNVSSDRAYSEEAAPLQVAKRYVTDVETALSHAGLSLQWDDAEVKSPSDDPNSFAVRVPVGDQGNTYLHVDVFRGEAKGALIIGYDSTKTSAEILNLDYNTISIVTNLQTHEPEVVRTSDQSTRILQTVVQALSSAKVAPLNPGVAALIHGIREDSAISLLCSAADAPMYSALLSAVDNLNAAVDRMYDALDAYEVAAAAMWAACSACAAGVVGMCGPCAGLTVAYFAARDAFYDAVDAVDYWSDQVDSCQEQVSDWVAANC